MKLGDAFPLGQSIAQDGARENMVKQNRVMCNPTMREEYVIEMMSMNHTKF